MASFLTSYAPTLKHEGFYANHPHDKGGETYRGIARNRWPEWSGWAIIDGAKLGEDFPASLRHNPDLESLIQEFYREKFWAVIRGDELTQRIADEMFDTAVNTGTGRAIRFLQRALNVLNRNGRNYPDIKVDGHFGQATMTALRSYLSNDMDGPLVKVLNILQGMHYINLMESDPTQEAFARGWLERT